MDHDSGNAENPGNIEMKKQGRRND